jgi:predicted  nucleic acid-binding Zn ribbon protein
VLLHNGNKFASIPVAHSTHLKETYENLQTVSKKIKYHKHEWSLCGDLKVSGVLLGQQGGNTKFPCFLCEWDSRARDKHWTTKEWSKRENFIPGTKNMIYVSLVDQQEVLLAALFAY